MSARVYVLIDTVEGKAKQAAKILYGQPGITVVDCVEGPPDIVMMAEVEDQQALARLTVQALASVENLTTDIRFLPVSSRATCHLHRKPSVAFRRNQAQNAGVRNKEPQVAEGKLTGEG